MTDLEYVEGLIGHHPNFPVQGVLFHDGTLSLNLCSLFVLTWKCSPYSGIQSQSMCSSPNCLRISVSPTNTWTSLWASMRVASCLAPFLPSIFDAHSFQFARRARYEMSPYHYLSCSRASYLLQLPGRVTCLASTKEYGEDVLEVQVGIRVCHVVADDADQFHPRWAEVHHR